MKILCIATHKEGYLDLLEESAALWGYDLKVLGWGRKWRGLSWKIELYLEELEKLSKKEIILCVDGYDVLVTGSPEETLEKYHAFNAPVIFSGQRYFPNKSWVRHYSDMLMSNTKLKSRVDLFDEKDYSRPCMGLLIAQVDKLIELFKKFRKIEEEQSIGNDQIILNMYYLDHQDEIYIDTECVLFQNLWRTRKGIYGKLLLRDSQCEIEVVEQDGRKRIQNRKFNTYPCLLHAPVNLDINSVLLALGYKFHKHSIKKNWHYWQYSVMYYVKRGCVFFGFTKIFRYAMYVIVSILSYLLFRYFN